MKQEPMTRGIRGSIAAACMCAVLPACGGGGGLSGTYLPAGNGLGNGVVMEKMEFGSGHNVTLTMLQQRIRVTYEIDGKQLLLTANGQQMVFDIVEGNCLDGGGLFGKFCRS
jgi:hypothetical protein